MPPLRFVFDQHINAPALRKLREVGVDMVHVVEVGLGEADDADILAWATREERIVVTRNYRDVVPLVEAKESGGSRSPVSCSLRHRSCSPTWATTCPR